MHLQPATYDLTSYAIVGGTLVLAACAITAVLMLRWRAISDSNARAGNAQ